MVKTETSSSKRVVLDSKFAYRLFYPQVALIICSKFESDVAAMPAVSCMPISIEPPLVALAILRKTRTCKIIRSSHRFSINWIDYSKSEDRKAILDLANRSKMGVSNKLKGARVPYKIMEGVPVLDSSVAYAICDLSRIVTPSGDHDLFIAQMMKIMADRGSFRQYWNFDKYKPSIYLGSKFKRQIVTL